MKGEWLLLLIIIPALAGLLGYFIPRRGWGLSALISLLVSGFCGVISGWGFISAKSQPIIWSLGKQAWLGFWKGRALLLADALAMGMAFLASILGFILLFWAVGYFRKNDNGTAKNFFANAMWILAGSYAVFFSDHLLALCVFWGFLGIPFYLMLQASKEANDASKKTLIILGATDSMLIMGAGLVWFLTRNFWISKINLPTNCESAILAYLLIISASFAKAGGMPFHSWIPDASETGPTPAVALVPASLDKLLGIYLLVRVSLDLFVLTSGVKIVLLVIGAITIVAGVLAALVQHHFRRLLGFHAVSQVGYMIVGVGTATGLGVIAGLFHMLNNAIYKALLFLGAGEIEKRTGTQELKELGGLAKLFPISFFSFLIGALAISGIPPLNGFFSKWMIYQSIIKLSEEFPRLWVFILISAMFGSALTLASFIKLLYSSYLGPKPRELMVNDNSSGWFCMRSAMLILALGCLALGIFGNWLGLKWLLEPMLGKSVKMLGFWAPISAVVLLLFGLGVGYVIYLFGAGLKYREDDTYMLGEKAEEFHYSGPDFYRTVEAELGLFSRLYQWMEGGWYDLYDWGRRITFYFSDLLRYLHSGNLLTYIAWCLLGVVVLLWAFFQLG